jgi:protein gp37
MSKIEWTDKTWNPIIGGELCREFPTTHGG